MHETLVKTRLLDLYLAFLPRSRHFLVTIDVFDLFANKEQYGADIKKTLGLCWHDGGG